MPSVPHALAHRRGAGARLAARGLRALRATLCLSLLLGAATASAQAPLLGERITFDFTGSTFSLLGGTITTPPDGTVDVGTARLFVEGPAPGSYADGGAFVVENLDIAGTVATNILGSADVSGTYAASLAQPWAGTLAAGASGGDFFDDLLLDLDVVLGCTGIGCASLGLPINDSGVSVLSVSFLPVSDLTLPGQASIQASIAIQVDGVLGQIDLVGVEVARAFVPEPGTAVLLALGLAALARPVRRRR